MAAAKSQKTAKSAKIAKSAKSANAKTASTAKAVALDDFLTLNIETRALLEALSQALSRLERAIDRAEHVGISALNAPPQEPTPDDELEDGERERDGATES